MPRVANNRGSNHQRTGRPRVFEIEVYVLIEAESLDDACTQLEIMLFPAAKYFLEEGEELSDDQYEKDFGSDR